MSYQRIQVTHNIFITALYVKVDKPIMCFFVSGSINIFSQLNGIF